jgi:hypothetical protein
MLKRQLGEKSIHGAWYPYYLKGYIKVLKRANLGYFGDFSQSKSEK